MKEQPKFEEVFSQENLKKAALLCFKHKGNNLSILLIKSKLSSYIKQLHNTLINDKYKFSGFRHFRKLNGSKERNISALYIKDSIVYKCLCQSFIIPCLMNKLIYDSVASQKRKGLHFAFKRLKRFLRDHYLQHQDQGAALIFDIKDFFETIVHDKIKDFLYQYVKDKKLYDFICKIIDTNQFLMRRKKFRDNQFRGLGLGTELSQLLALIFISPLDHYIKEELKVKYYLRYMDDAIIIKPTITELLILKRKIKKYLSTLGLKLNNYKTRIIKLTEPIPFLRLKFYIGNKVITKMNFHKIKKHIKQWKIEYEQGLKSEKEIKEAYVAWRAYAVYTDDYNRIKQMDNYFYNIFKQANSPNNSFAFSL